MPFDFLKGWMRVPPMSAHTDYGALFSLSHCHMSQTGCMSSYWASACDYRMITRFSPPHPHGSLYSVIWHSCSDATPRFFYALSPLIICLWAKKIVILHPENLKGGLRGDREGRNSRCLKGSLHSSFTFHHSTRIINRKKIITNPAPCLILFSHSSYRLFRPCLLTQRLQRLLLILLLTLVLLLCLTLASLEWMV